MSCCAFTPSRCHIDLAALRRNFARLGEPGSIMPVVKSDAYGHGLLPVARAPGRGRGPALRRGHRMRRRGFA